MIAAGQSIGSYRILSKIGTGGMGAVYLAEHPLIGKKVALKVIHKELANNQEVVKRFFQEAQAVTKIGHEHIVDIHDFAVTPDGDHFYIMEYLEGQTLAAVLGRERTIEIMRALHIGAQIASALAAAHAAGVIHRDLKPDNVMLTKRLGDPDFVKLLDFGLAKMFAGGNASPVKTAAGVLLGTPQYMSPEACESRQSIDHRTDIYALGILLFQMMTGLLPFDGETMGEVLVKQVTQLPPAPRGFNPQIPPSVEQILLRCLMKAPDARFPTMNALREALLDPEKYLHKSPPIAPARSLAPGEAPDAKTVIQYAEAQQKTKIGMSGMPPAASNLPLPAPAPSLPGNAGAKTMIAQPAPYQQHAPARTQILGPDLAAPAQLKMNTMRIATPLGYSSRPPRRMWPIVLVLALLLGLGGGAFAVAWFGHAGKHAPATTGSGSAAAVGSARGSGAAVTAIASAVPPAGSAAPVTHVAAGSASPPVGSASPPAGSASPPVGSAKTGSASESAPLAVIVIDSVPQGAEVIGPDKKSLGKTPAHLSLPISDQPVTFELKLAGYHKKTKQLMITGNTVISVPLDRVYVPSGTANHQGPGSGDANSLMRPDDL